jgi:threonyl-tRNA synthetase
VESEIFTLIHLIFDFYRLFGFTDVEVKLSTRPENYIGSLEVWNQAEAALTTALENAKIDYRLNPGDGAFYGPKIDFVVKDSLKRSWQLGTIQLDFSMPVRFGLEYVASDGSTKRPVMIHRAVLGSFERFFGVLLEHTAGNLPLWLSPTQVSVLTISEKFTDYAQEVVRFLRPFNLRASADLRGEKVTRKVRDAEVNKVPYMLIVGEKESQNRQVSIRKHGQGDMGTYTLEEAAAFLQGEVAKSRQPAPLELVAG